MTTEPEVKANDISVDRDDSKAKEIIPQKEKTPRKKRKGCVWVLLILVAFLVLGSTLPDSPPSYHEAIIESESPIIYGSQECTLEFNCTAEQFVENYNRLFGTKTIRKIDLSKAKYYKDNETQTERYVWSLYGNDNFTSLPEYYLGVPILNEIGFIRLDVNAATGNIIELYFAISQSFYDDYSLSDNDRKYYLDEPASIAVEALGITNYSDLFGEITDSNFDNKPKYKKGIFSNAYVKNDFIDGNGETSSILILTVAAVTEKGFSQFQNEIS